MAVVRNIFVKPLIGINYNGDDIKFGMCPKEVENILGQNGKYEVDTLLNEIYEPREGKRCLYKNDKLFSVEITADTGYELFYEEIDILNDKDIVSKLTKYDIPVEKNERYVIFEKLGILLGGVNSKYPWEKRFAVLSNESNFNQRLFTTADIIVIPLQGVLYKGRKVNYGMTQQDVINILGNSACYQANEISKVISEQRNGVMFEYENGLLSSLQIQINSGLNILYEDINIFNDKETVAKLKIHDTPTSDNGQYMNFYKLGICLGGFGKKKIPENKYVFLFSESKLKFFEMLFKIGGGKNQ